MGWMTDPLAEPPQEEAAAPGTSTWTPPDPVAANAPAPNRSFWDSKDVAKSTGSGLVRGTTGMIDTALTGGRPAPGQFTTAPIDPNKPLSEQSVKIIQNDVAPVAPVTNFATEKMPNVMSYEPTSTAGGYGQTIGEFAPGMLFPAGRGRILDRAIYNVVAPAVASETAGLVSQEFFPDNESAEAFARLAGGFMGGPLAKGLETGVRAVRKPTNVDPLMATLERNGVSTTAGNYARDPQLLAREAAAPRTAEILANQPMQFRDAALRAARVPVPNETQTVMDVLERARKQAGSTYSRVTQNLPMVPSRLHATRMRNIAADYSTKIEAGLESGTIKQVQQAIENSFRTGVPISAKQIGNWRSAVSEATRSGSSVARQSAIETLKVLDDVIGRSLAQAGRADDIALLGQARAQYRDILALEGGLLKSGKLGDEGLITPNALVSSLTNQGKEAFMRGRRGELADLARAGRARLVPVEKLPPVKPTNLGTAARIAGDTAGSLLGYEVGQHLFPDNAMLQYLAGGVGTGAAELLRKGVKGGYNAVLSSRAMQEAMKRAAQNPASGASPLMGGVVGSLTAGPQANGGRVERKAGGRVGLNHDKLADQLVGAAERAKKGISKGTEALLDMPDDHVAHALEVANRSI